MEAERKVGGEPRDVRLLGAFVISEWSFGDRHSYRIRELILGWASAFD